MKKIDQLVFSDRKSIGIKITPEGEVEVRAPRGFPQRRIKQLVAEKQHWIKKKLVLMQQKLAQIPKRRFVGGEEFLYLGRQYQLELVKDLKEEVVLNGRLQVRKQKSNRVKTALEKWYRSQAEKVLKTQAAIFIKQEGFSVNKIKISWAKKRWGSYSSKTKNLNFNWRIVMAPIKVLDYVVVHELVHSEQQNHSAKFWKRVNAILPDYRKHKQWLNNNSHLLKL